MTERDPGREHPVELLADLDAGLLDPARAAQVRADAEHDARAGAVLAALAATRAELASLGDPPVPAEFAARWDAALAEEARNSAGRTAPDDGTPAAPGVPTGHQSMDGAPSDQRSSLPRTTRRPEGPPPDALRPPRRIGRLGRARLRRLRPALVAAAVLAAAVVGEVLRAPGNPAPLSLDGVDLATAGVTVRGDFDVGDLADPVRRAGCLRAVTPPGVPPDALLLGGRDVVLDGHHGVLLLLAGGRRGHLHVVVVDPECGPQGGTLLGAQTIGE